LYGVREVAVPLRTRGRGGGVQCVSVDLLRPEPLVEEEDRVEVPPEIVPPQRPVQDLL